jgi:hypothetical protein
MGSLQDVKCNVLGWLWWLWVAAIGSVRGLPDDKVKELQLRDFFSSIIEHPLFVRRMASNGTSFK